VFPEKIAKSHRIKLTRMLEDIQRASKDIDALRLAYLQIAEDSVALAHGDSALMPCAGVQNQGCVQAGRCSEILQEHSVLKSSIERALYRGTDGKQVASLQLQLDNLEDERDMLDSNLRAAQQSYAVRRQVALGQEH